MTIVDYLNNLLRDEIIEPEHECSAAEVSGAICLLLSEIILKDAEECDKLANWEYEIRKLRCKMLGGHTWEYDHCCYWGHQYCSGCHQYKYPELGKLSCSEAREKIGKIEESEYIQ